jgi:hypothetical protein
MTILPINPNLSEIARIRYPTTPAKRDQKKMGLTFDKAKERPLRIEMGSFLKALKISW